VAGIKWWTRHRSRLREPEKRIIQEWPADSTPKVTILIALIAMTGSKIFGAMENWSAFVDDPLKMLLSPNDFAFYGGLTAALISMWLYYRRWGQERLRIMDALAPSALVGYAIGRLGCHVSGDGDWGIGNLRPKPFSWMPDWLWAYQYPHNILKQGVYMQGCDWGEYCYQLPAPVFPTPLYEFAGSFFFLAVLWMLRKRIKAAGRLTALYMMLMGAGRLLIEQMRVNISYSVWGLSITQAEFISILVIIIGAFLYIRAPHFAVNKNAAIL